MPPPFIFPQSKRYSDAVRIHPGYVARGGEQTGPQLRLFYSGEMNRLSSGVLKSGSGRETLPPLPPVFPVACFSGETLLLATAGAAADAGDCCAAAEAFGWEGCDGCAPALVG